MRIYGISWEFVTDEDRPGVLVDHRMTEPLRRYGHEKGKYASRKYWMRFPGGAGNTSANR